MSYSDSSYLKPVFSPDTLRDCVNSVVREAKKLADFDSIAFQGMSGSLVASAAALRLRKNMLLIRKPTDNTHSSKKVEGNIDKSFIIVDDLISSGTTLVNIYNSVRSVSPKARCIGILLYNQEGSIWVNHAFGEALKATPVIVCRYSEESDGRSCLTGFPVGTKKTARQIAKGN